MLDQAATALVVLDEDADTCGWINERMLARAYEQSAVRHEDAAAQTVQEVMNEDVPECPSDIPLAAAAQLMADAGVDHLFFMHHAGGRTWPASVLSRRDLVRVLAGPEYIKDQGTAAPRPTPLDLFRQRYGMAKER
jgi:predicted transcriptional regulator